MATQPSFSNYYTVADLEGFQWVAGEGVAGVGGGGVVKPYWNPVISFSFGILRKGWEKGQIELPQHS